MVALPSIADAPDYRIPPDHKVEQGVYGMSAQTWHLPRDKWRKIRERSGGEAVCAVLDTGWTQHPDIAEPVDVKSYIRGEDGRDFNGHGMHCAGTVASTDEDIGVSQKARIMVKKVLSNSGSGSSAGIAQAIRDAADEGADVISLSLGGGSAYRPTLDAITYAMNKGVIVVIAAGNSGFNGRNNTIGWPAKGGGGVVVAALKSDYTTASFSSGGEQLTVAAPGQQILSLSHRGSGFAMMSGTSMATPFVAGVMCHVIEQGRMHGHARMTGKQAVEEFIKAN